MTSVTFSNLEAQEGKPQGMAAGARVKERGREGKQEVAAA